MARKSPQEKKKLSYLKDRRNSYGESDKASRKAIPRRKQVQSQAERRIVRQALGGIRVAAEPDRVDEALAREKLQRKSGWAKSPDTPLGKMLERSLRRRVKEGMLPPEVAEAKAKPARKARKGRPQRHSW
ncbi:MAG TPA: hypothetical protein VJN95_06290 [Gemmatimonadales bacterium]|nr:hypothetical protein [Gemmatimonadales bacterium]